VLNHNYSIFNIKNIIPIGMTLIFFQCIFIISQNPIILAYGSVIALCGIYAYINKITNPFFLALLSSQFCQIYFFIILNNHAIKLDSELQYPNYLDATVLMLNLLMMALIAIIISSKPYSREIKIKYYKIKTIYLIIFYFICKILYIILKNKIEISVYYNFINNIILISLILYIIRDIKNKYLYQLLFILLIELSTGFFEYSSYFKNCIFIYIVVLVATYRIRTGNIVAVSMVLILLGTFWEANKVEYRNFQQEKSADTSITQVVNRSYFESYGFLLARVSTFGLDEFNYGFYKILNRISYVEPMANVMQIAPMVIGPQDGLIERIYHHISHPRIFYPNKVRLDDSYESNLFTEYAYAGADKGVSASVGYLTQLYIYFDSYWLYIACFLIWYLFCQVFNFVIFFGKNSLLAYALAINIFYSNFLLLESSLVKIIGGVISYTIASLAILLAFRFFSCKTKNY